ncbi:MAG: hypothetical protein IPL62_20625 [Caulobacteraceae bacterium]|nr:hypothetical protein [Caulobacteraceae bacterium]
MPDYVFKVELFPGLGIERAEIIAQLIHLERQALRSRKETPRFTDRLQTAPG